jgi:serine/threonine protein kinase
MSVPHDPTASVVPPADTQEHAPNALPCTATGAKPKDPPNHSLPATVLPPQWLDDRCARTYPEVPDYVIESEIGAGGMGLVYRARELAFNRDVAIKVLQDRYPADSVIARRFLDEARITGQLQHPGIPPVHHIGTLPGGRPFLAMKLIKGETLADLLENNPENRTTFVPVFAQVCQAVAYAHSRKVIHRDLKPANIMVGSFGEVQVMDWGLAKVLTGQAEISEPTSFEAERTEIRTHRGATMQLRCRGSLKGRARKH